MSSVASAALANGDFYLLLSWFYRYQINFLKLFKTFESWHLRLMTVKKWEPDDVVTSWPSSGCCCDLTTWLYYLGKFLPLLEIWTADRKRDQKWDETRFKHVIKPETSCCWTSGKKTTFWFFPDVEHVHVGSGKKNTEIYQFMIFHELILVEFVFDVFLILPVQVIIYSLIINVRLLSMNQTSWLVNSLVNVQAAFSRFLWKALNLSH